MWWCTEIPGRGGTAFLRDCLLQRKKVTSGDASQISTGVSVFCTGHVLYVYPVSAETLEPLARFVRKLPMDLNFADEGFPGLKNQGFLESFGTNYSLCSA